VKQASRGGRGVRVAEGKQERRTGARHGTR
jgi:hypothetical protein